MGGKEGCDYFGLAASRGMARFSKRGMLGKGVVGFSGRGGRSNVPRGSMGARRTQDIFKTKF